MTLMFYTQVPEGRIVNKKTWNYIPMHQKIRQERFLMYIYSISSYVFSNDCPSDKTVWGAFF